jgi:DNA-binding LacI/PurR family transcriptional regulator
MGRKAMEMLVRHMKDPDAKSAHVSVPTRLILRGSEKADGVQPRLPKTGNRRNIV